MNKNMLKDAIAWTHLKLFGHPISKEMTKFVNNLGWVFMGTVIAKFLVFLIQIVGGRFLGQKIYGEYNLIVSTAAFLIIPVLIATLSTGVIKYLPSLKSDIQRKRMISTSARSYFVGLISFSLFYVVMYLLFREQITSFLNIDDKIAILSIVGMVVWTSHAFSEGLLRSLQKLKELGKTTLIANIIAFIVFIILMMTTRDSITLFIPLFGTYLIYASLSFRMYKDYLKDRFHKPIFKKLLKYSKYIFFVTIASAFLGNIDKVMLNAYLNIESVGLYQAYFTSSTIVTSTLVMMFLTVFFPTINKFAKKKPIFKKLNKLMFRTLPVLIVVLPIQIFVLVKYFYGYPIFYATLIGFALSTIFYVIAAIYGTLLISINTKSVIYYSASFVSTAALNLVLNLWLIPRYFLTGAIISTIISGMVLSLLIIIFLRKFMREER